MTTTPQAALLSAQNPLLKRCYTMSESHLSGYRVVIGFERLEDAQDAHEYIAKLQATQEPVQAGELPDERALFERAARQEGCTEFLRVADAYVDRRTLRCFRIWQKARAALSARKPLTPLTPAQMEKGRDQLFSINNPFCPCDSKTFSKVAEWVERHHGIGLEVKP